MIDETTAVHNLNLLAQYPPDRLGVGRDGRTLELDSNQTAGLEEVIRQTFAYAEKQDGLGHRLWAKQEIEGNQVRCRSPGNILKRLQPFLRRTTDLDLPDEERIELVVVVPLDGEEKRIDLGSAIELINDNRISIMDLVHSLGGLDALFKVFNDQHWKSLKVLKLRNGGWISNEEFIRLIQQCPNLTSLSVPPSVSGDVLSVLASTPNLEFLDISYCIELDPNALDHLKHTPELTNLVMISCNNLRPDALMNLAHVKKLQVLDISQCLLECGALNYLSEVPGLRTLKMCACYGLAGDTLKHLAHVPLLEDLDLSECDYLDANSFCHFVEVLHLRYLSFNWCPNFEPTSMVYLEKLQELELLSVRGCFQLLPSFLETTKLSPNLKHLNVGGCFQLNQTGERLAGLDRFPLLESTIEPR